MENDVFTKEGLILTMFDRYSSKLSDEATRTRWSSLVNAVKAKQSTIDKTMWLQASDCK